MKLNRGHRLKYIPDAAYARILSRAKIRRRKDWALLFIAGHLGLRVSEAVILRGSAFDWSRNIAAVPTLKQRERPPPALEVFFSSSDGSVELQMHEAVAVALGVRPENSVLFPTSSRQAQNLWHYYAGREGWNELGFHALRHWFGVATYRDSRDVVYTQRQMRHSSLSSTMVYVDLVDAERTARRFRGIQG